jgi:putative ABC transport system permease protein
MANQKNLQEMNEEHTEEIQSQMEEINTTASIIEVTPGPGMSIQGEGMSIIGGNVFMNESIAYNISSLEGTEDVVPILEKSIGEMINQSSDGFMTSYFKLFYAVRGIPLNSSLLDRILPVNIIEGRNLREGDNGVVLLTSNLTEYFEAGVGDTININGADFEVVGIYESTFINEVRLYMSLPDAQGAFNLAGKISMINVYAENVSEVDEIANEIKSNYGLDARTSLDRMNSLEMMRESMESQEESMATAIDQMQTTGFQEIIVALIATSAMVLFIMLYTVHERTREIGVLKAVGFTGRSIMTQFLFEGTIIGLMGGIVGAFIGGVGAPLLANTFLPKPETGGALPPGPVPGLENAAPVVVVTPELILFVIGMAVLLGALGSLYPAWRASRKSPMEAMRHE